MLITAVAIAAALSALSPSAKPSDHTPAALNSAAERMIRAGDIVRIERFAEPCNLTIRDLTVRSDGTITLPLIGVVRVAGFTTTRLIDYLNSRLKKYVNRSDVSLHVLGGF